MDRDDDTEGLPGDVLNELTIPVAVDVQRVVDLLERLHEGKLDLGVMPGRLAGLDTAVVVLELPGGLLPVFAYVNEEIAAVLRNRHGDLPAPVGGGPRLLAS